MELSRRLQGVCDMVTKGNRVADVGCDHGYVSIYLVEHKISPYVIAMDINKGPLMRAKTHIQEYQKTELIETRLSDGMKALRHGEADTLICAGMGGKLVMNILTAGKDVAAGIEEFILQPQSEIALVRNFLKNQGYMIQDETMVLEEGKYYPILKVIHCQTSQIQEHVDSDKADITLEDRFGPVLLKKKHPVLLDFLQREKEKNQNIIHDLEVRFSSEIRHQQRILELKNELLAIEEAIHIIRA